ncbi:MAG: DUF2157 domain-containing protein [Pseudomonadota bacterium]
MSERKALIALLEHDLISKAHRGDAIKLAGVHPSPSQWLAFIDKLLMALGILAISFSVLFFIAYNWAEIGRFAKFGLVEIAMVIAVAISVRSGPGSDARKFALLGACVLLGVLLALFGQTYQTGADPWQLFFNWALLMTPWAIVGRFSSIWLLWLGLLNLSMLLHFKTFGGIFGLLLLPLWGGEAGLLWCLFIFNSVALVIWEACARQMDSLTARWAPRTIAVAAGVPITALAFFVVVGSGFVSIWSVPIWLFWAFITRYYYQSQNRDLFILAGLALSLSVVIIGAVAEVILDSFGDVAFLVLALLVIGAGSLAAMWLRSVQNATSS